MAIDLTPITNSRSGNVKSAGFDPTTGILRVEYSNGRKYDYHGVDNAVYEAFRAAPSAGEYLHKVIKVGNPAAPVPEG